MFVQPSTLRIFPDHEYVKAGAVVQEDLSPASVILAVKEVPVHKLLGDRTYVFFSHTIKAQEYNMNLLDACLAQNIRLLDYEKIVDAEDNRLVRFGRYAGYAGMIDQMHILGNRLLGMGYSTPFLHVGYTHMYLQLDYARQAIAGIGREIEQAGTPRSLGPLIFTFTGSGSVSQGAREMFDLLPHEYVTPERAREMVTSGKFDNRKVYAILATSAEVVRLKGAPADAPVDKEHYYQHPEQYESTFAERIAPYTSVLVNCLYWDQRYPRLLTHSQMEQLVRARRSRLIALADLSADPGGSVEFMQRLTTIDRPFYTYDVERQSMSDDIALGKGIVISSVDNLPTEIPVEASQYFGDSLFPFIENLVKSDGSLPFAEQLDLTPELRSAVITSHGELTPDFQYITEFRQRNARKKRSTSAKHRVLVLGSGMVAGPTVDLLLARGGTHVTVASDDISAAERLVAGRDRGEAAELDVADAESLAKLVRSHDVVVSLLPPPLHVPVARVCIDERRSLVTTSYISRRMKELSDEARRAGITILCEVGLDPGIDHLLAMRVINEAAQRNARLVSFVSHCGGLPAPEASNNLLGYKFSWSPRGVLQAGLNAARYLQRGDVIEHESGTIFDAAHDTNFLPGFACEVVPNRDSLEYAELYGASDAHTFVRGTLRYRGFSRVMAAMCKLGLLDFEPSTFFTPGAPAVTWREVLASKIPDFAGYDVELAVLRQLGLDNPERAEDASAVEAAFRWLGLFDGETPVAQKGSSMEALCELMQQRMAYDKNERDIVLLQHYFTLKEKDGRETQHRSRLVVYGDENHSAMAKTVGTPAAIATQLILGGQIIRSGVVAPLTPDIYSPMLQELEKVGLESIEETEQ